MAEKEQERLDRRPRYVPGLRNIFLFFALVLLPAIIICAWLDSTANHLVYSWPFVVAVAVMFFYGLPVAVDIGRRGGAAYVATGFAAFLVAVKLIGANPDRAPIAWGMAIGWFSGMAVISCFMWLRLRREWNAGHPYMRC